MSEFLSIMESLTKQGDRWTATIPEDWLQGRTCFGGLTAALMVRALRLDIGGTSPLQSIDVSFIAPIPAGEITLSTEILRSGKYVTHATASIIHNGQIATRLHAIIGERRHSKIDIKPPELLPSKAVSDTIIMPFIPGIMPEFSQHIEYRPTEGDLPFSGAKQAVIGGYFRHLTSADNSIESMIALMDAWPPAVLVMGKAPFAASTVRWTIHFLNDIPQEFNNQADNDYWWYRSSALAAQGGYATTTAHIYANNKPIAWAEQLVAIFDS